MDLKIENPFKGKAAELAEKHIEKFNTELRRIVSETIQGISDELIKIIDIERTGDGYLINILNLASDEERRGDE